MNLLAKKANSHGFPRKRKDLQYIADECKSPGEFVKTVMKVKGMTYQKLARILGTSDAYIGIAISKNLFGPKACLKFSRALGVDPYILSRIEAEYYIKKLIEKEEQEKG